MAVTRSMTNSGRTYKPIGKDTSIPKKPITEAVSPKSSKRVKTIFEKSIKKTSRGKVKKPRAEKAKKAIQEKVKKPIQKKAKKPISEKVKKPIVEPRVYSPDHLFPCLI